MKIAGTGYVGLSNVMLLAQHHKVVALDIDTHKVQLLNDKLSPIEDPEFNQFLAERALNFRAKLTKSRL